MVAEHTYSLTKNAWQDQCFYWQVIIWIRACSFYSSWYWDTNMLNTLRWIALLADFWMNDYADDSGFT